MEDKRIKRICNITKTIIAAALVGIITGAIAAGFGRALIAITEYRENHSLWLIPFLGFIGFFIVKSYERWGGESKRGMTLVFEAGHGTESEIPIAMIPLVIVGTWLTHLFGGSAGREGVAVQIGGTVGYRMGILLRDDIMAKLLLTAGMAAGFSGLFRTPIAATFFALEVLVAGEIKYKALVPTIVASGFAYVTSAACGLEKFAVNITDDILINPENIVKLVIIAIAFGGAGRLFAILLHYLKKRFGIIFKDASKRALIIGIGVSVVSLLLYCGRYSGLGTNLIASSFLGGEIYAWDWIIKLLLTVITLAAGYQGGEVTPLFSIGATLGLILGSFFGLPVMLVAALGYAAVFSSATNTLLGPIFIGAEVFGFQHMPLFCLVCAIAYGCNGNKTIYPKQKLIIKQK